MGNFFSFLRGYLKIKVRGYSPERFMNLCSNHGISLWGIRQWEDDSEKSAYVMYIGLSDFFRLRPIARKTGTRAVVLERYGLPFFLQKIKKRTIFAVGLPCCLLFLIMMSQFIWAIEFEGNYAITDDVLLDFLKENGVDFGVYKDRIDIEQLEDGIREYFQAVTWTSIKVEGTRLVVKLKENDLLTDLDTEGNREDNDCIGSDLIANADGVIYSILTRQGVPMVAAGDSVRRGDVLVAGTIPVLSDDGTIKEYQYCHADADIQMDYGLEFRKMQPLYYEYRNYTGREKKNIFLGFGEKHLYIPLHHCDFLLYDTMEEIKQIQILPQIYLPLYYGVEIHREYFTVEAVYETDIAENLLQERIDKNIKTLIEKGVQIIQKDVTIDTVGKSVYLHGIFRLRGPVGQSRPLETKDLPIQETDVGSS